MSAGRTNAVSAGGGDEWVTGTFDLRAYCACESKDGPIWVNGQNRTIEVRKNSLLFVYCVDAGAEGNVETLGSIIGATCFKVLGDFEVWGRGIS